MHVSCFVKTFIVILFKMHVACFVKKLIVTLSKEIDKMIRTNKLLFPSMKTQMYVAYFVKTFIVTLFKEIYVN